MGMYGFSSLDALDLNTKTLLKVDKPPEELLHNKYSRPSWPTESAQGNHAKYLASRRFSTPAVYEHHQRRRQSVDVVVTSSVQCMHTKYRKRYSVQGLRARINSLENHIEMTDNPFNHLNESGGGLTASSVGEVFQYPSSPNTPGIVGSLNSLPEQKSVDSASIREDPDKLSVIQTSAVNHNGEHKTKNNLYTLMSVIYAFLVISLETIFPLLPSVDLNFIVDNVFSIINCLIGIGWMMFLQLDIALYKRRVAKKIKEKLVTIDRRAQGVSTEAVLEELQKQDYNNETGAAPLYMFQKGRHAGSFFLKIGMTVFCFGHLIYEGLILAEVVMADYENNESFAMLLTIHILRPVYSFYQLFVVFKYSHVIINHFPSVARFGLMHLIATSITSWFRSIISEAAASHDNHNSTHDRNPFTRFDIYGADPTNSSSDNPLNGLQLYYYLYPFTIEFSIIIAGVWFIMWLNIGNVDSHNACDAHLEPTLLENELGDLDLTYRSQLIISADCHSANRGIFAGLGLLLLSFVTVIVFFVLVGVRNEKGEYLYQDYAFIIYNLQELLLTGIALIVVALAFVKTASLSFNPDPITFLDDCLLVIPIPFFFMNTALNVVAELFSPTGCLLRAGILLLHLIQVIVQTPMLIDGLRRCSVTSNQSYHKPGRELVTFLIIINLAMWVVFTFEQKKADSLLAASEFFESRWIYISHITVPLMLFYRFHSAVCFADIWKSAYEKDEE